jgi:hypothetical protein
MIELDAAELARRVADPAASETLPSTVIAVTLRDTADLARVADLTELIRPLPCVFVALAQDSAICEESSGVESAFDIVLNTAPAGPAVVSQAGVAAAIAALDATVTSAPIASTSLVLLLRAQATTLAIRGEATVIAALTAESALYSALQAGPEFEAWRSSRPSRADCGAPARLRVERVGDLLHVTLSRPRKRNALDMAMRDQLIEALRLAAIDERIRVLLDGEGPDFCAGGDLDEFGSRPDPATAHATRMARNIPLSIERIRTRMEVRVHGACYGAGIELPAFADHIVATPDATFALPEIQLGLIPGAGGTVSITRRIGRQRTTYMALSAMPIDAATALAWGLIDDVAAAG